MAAVLILSGLFVPWLARTRGARTAIAGITVTAGLFFVALQFAAPYIKSSTAELGRYVKAHASANDRVFHYYDFYQDFTFYAERPVGVVGSGTGRNALGNTSALIAAFTGDRSESRCGLNPGPIESMPTMIWVTRGMGGVLCGVSVLCGAGGGLTVQAAAANPTRETTAQTVAHGRRARPDTPANPGPSPATGCGPAWWRPVRPCGPGRSPG
jgi:hypothetical protein